MYPSIIFFDRIRFFSDVVNSMNKPIETKNDGLGQDQMKALLSLGGIDPDPTKPKRDPAHMRASLHEQLTCALPQGSVFCEVLVTMMSEVGYDTRALAGQTLGEILFSPQSDIHLLQVVKDCAKVMSSSLDSKVETALATTIYYAALASALVHHDRMMTQHSYETLGESLTLLIEKHWMAPELMTLFAQARSMCQSRRGEP